MNLEFLFKEEMQYRIVLYLHDVVIKIIAIINFTVKSSNYTVLIKSTIIYLLPYFTTLRNFQTFYVLNNNRTTNH